MRILSWTVMALAGVILASSVGRTQIDPNPAMNNPDRLAWELFIQVNSPTTGSADTNNALFETWARDDDTFRTTPVWPNGPTPILGGPRALSLAMQSHVGFQPQVVPGGTRLVSEETRRNRPDFDFIVNNNLYKVSGLKAAYASGKTLSFPRDSLEVKANWVEVARLKEFNGFTGTAAEAAKLYHVNSTGGKQYALVAFHIISKLVPNWTWATFEHTDNPGRCDVLGCIDGFGAVNANVAPQSPTETATEPWTPKSTHYAACVKSPALAAMLAAAKLDPAFSNYCLKGSQADFADPTGLSYRVGNSVTEFGFVAQASCMSCHARAGFDATGKMSSFAGFDPVSPDRPGNEQNNIGNAPVGTPRSTWFWVPSGMTGANTRIAQPADFVWSVPFCAIDDTATPAETRSKYCRNK